MATVAFYGSDDKIATKVVVACIDESEDVVEMAKWFSSDGLDLREAEKILVRIDALLKKWDAKSIIMASALIGCPHEEGIDYSEGEACPECPPNCQHHIKTGEWVRRAGPLR